MLNDKDTVCTDIQRPFSIHRTFFQCTETFSVEAPSSEHGSYITVQNTGTFSVCMYMNCTCYISIQTHSAYT